jgi:LmbE family N-acetylglucosaminyl deacetylase
VTTRRSVTIVSPHYDDVPLSLGQSLSDGALAATDVRVRVAFGRSNWTNWVHPTRSRATPISWWRRIEETVAARSFGYRWTSAGWEEALLRWGTAGGDRLLDETADLSDEPLVPELAAWLQDVAAGGGGDRPELVLVPSGLGGHADHRIVALAAARVAPELPVPVGFYEDRPYVAYLDHDAIEAQLAPLRLDLEVRAVSGPVTAATQRRMRRCYPSQIDRFFVEAMEHDLSAGAVERVWFPVGTAPAWFV